VLPAHKSSLKKLTTTPYRKALWKHSQRVIDLLGSLIPITEVYLLGSYTTKKRRPADVDFIVLLKTPKRRRGEKWAVDFVLAPEGAHEESILKDAKKWMQQKYGSKKSAVVRIK